MASINRTVALRLAGSLLMQVCLFCFVHYRPKVNLLAQDLFTVFWSDLPALCLGTIAFVLVLPVFRDMAEGEVGWRHLAALVLAAWPVCILLEVLAKIIAA